MGFSLLIREFQGKGFSLLIKQFQGKGFSIWIKEFQVSSFMNHIRMRAPPTLGAILHDHYDLFKHEVSGPSLFCFVFEQFEPCGFIMFFLLFTYYFFPWNSLDILYQYHACRRYASGSTPTRLLGSWGHRAARVNQISWQRFVAGDSSLYWGNLHVVGPAPDEGTSTQISKFVSNVFLHHTL